MSDTQKIVEGNFEIRAAAKRLINSGLSVLPCENKEPVSKIKSKGWNGLRTRPLNEKNFDFYFQDAQQIAIICGESKGCKDKIEAIDSDSKNDPTGKQNNMLLAAIKYNLPDVYDKLVIEETPSRGLHLIYKCSQVGGNQPDIARRPATPEEKGRGEKSLVLIETKGQGGYFVCYPSPGYKLIKGEFEDILSITPEERESLLNICRSFDQIGKQVFSGLRKKKEEAPEAPWNVFNKKNDYRWMAETLQKNDWKIVEETDDLICIKRPGDTKSKSSGSIWKGSNSLYLFSTSTEFEAGKPYSAFGIYTTLVHDGDWKAAAKDLSGQGIGIWMEYDREFYSVSDKGRMHFKMGAIANWMRDTGFYKFRYSNGMFEPVQVINNVVGFAKFDLIKKLFLNHIEKETKQQDEKIYDSFISKISVIFLESGGVISLLDDLDESKFLKSSPEKGWMFFRNKVLEVSSEGLQFVSYNDLSGYIWEGQIIQWDFKISPEEGDMKNFVKYISGNDGKDDPATFRPNEKKEESFRRTIGYLLHQYKDPSNSKAVIFYDEYWNEDNPDANGGTGKDLLSQLIALCRNAVTIDGKKFDPFDKFCYQTIGTDTELVILEDAPMNLDFEKLFNVITNDLGVERKGETAFKIPREKSPKWIITGNYVLKGSGGSHVRRKHELQLSSFFGENYSPAQHFGHRLIEQWQEKDWNAFYNYLVNCLVMFLKSGLGIGESLSEKLQRRRLIEATHPEFVQWMDKQLEDGTIIKSGEDPLNKESFLQKFTDSSPYYRHSRKPLGLTTFTRWLNKWCDAFGFKLDSSNRDKAGEMAYKITKARKTVTKPREATGEGAGEVREGVGEVREGGTGAEIIEKFLNPGYKPLADETPF